MSAAVCAFVVTFLTLSGPRGLDCAVGSGDLSRPTNVYLTSHNMNLVLKWDPPAGADRGLVYTTQFKTTLPGFKAGCVNTSALQCDFTRLNISIYEYGQYTGRVRAELGAQNSVWVKSNSITLDNDTIISAPNVTLHSSGASIEVSIRDPVFAVSTLRNVYSLSFYNITYWKEGQKEKAKNINNIQQNRVTLSDLQHLTKYCVQVQIITRNPNPSEPSKAVCESTGKKEDAPWLVAVVTVFIMVCAVAVVVVIVMHHKTISNFLCPKDVLPLHFKEWLLAPPNSSTLLVTEESCPSEEICNQVTICNQITNCAGSVASGGSRDKLQQTAHSHRGAKEEEEREGDEEEPTEIR